MTLNIIPVQVDGDKCLYKWSCLPWCKKQQNFKSWFVFFVCFFFNLIPVHPNIPGPHLQNQGPHRTNSSQRHGSSPPPGLAKWFGSDVLEQPLPSMPTKVISVDELELRP